MAKLSTSVIDNFNLPVRYGPSWSHLLTEPLENLRFSGRRAFLALSGIAVGCMAVVVLLNIAYNAKLQAMSVFEGMGSDLLVANIQPPTGSYSNTMLSVSKLNTDSLRRIIPSITAAAPLIPVNIDVRLKGQTLNTTALGSNDELFRVLDLKLEKGRFLSRYDVHNTHAVVGAKIIADLEEKGANVSLGDRIQIGRYLFEIIGILQPNGQNSLLPISLDETIVLPIEGMQRIVASPQISGMLVRDPDTRQSTYGTDQLKKWLSEQIPGFDVSIQIPHQLLEGMAQQSSLFSWLLAGIGGIALFVGGTGVMNVMVMSISERRREIGVRMALGARPKDIARLFLLEAAVLSAIGALTGAALGLFFSWLFVYFSGWPPFTLSVVSLPLGIGSAVTTGLFFGLSPAIVAARLSPVQALRDE